MSIDIRIAETKEEKKAIFELRYKVYIEEMHRPSHADHKNKIITDHLDENGVLIYGIDLNSGEVIGTIRTNLGKNSPLEFEEEYDMRRFKPYYPEQVSTTSKLIITKPYRRKKFILEMFIFLYKSGIENSIKYDFINVNSPLDKFYNKIGYKSYKENFAHPEFGEVIPMVLPLDDFKLKK